MKENLKKEIENFFSETRETTSEFDKAFDLGVEAAEIRREIEKWEAVVATTAADLKTKREELEKLNNRLHGIHKWFRDNQEPGHPGQPAKTKPKASITEAIEYVAEKLSESGNTELIKKGNLPGFLKHLKETITEGNPNFSDYVKERIQEVKNLTGDCQIVMQSRTKPEKLRLIETRKHEIIRKNRVSALLSAWRKSRL